MLNDPASLTETMAVRFDLYECSPGVLLDEREVAAALHVSRKTLQHWRAMQRGPRFRRIEGLVRYRAGDLVQWLEATRG
ncbi:helix-turn-helix domain-containing protein [Agrococcus citreus]|uniref:Helix-turn-helix domain-containing protein n=1 Tax=Agrococcus citreus TaxID=84643 RepID=A0ABP4JH99_9MICO